MKTFEIEKRKLGDLKYSNKERYIPEYKIDILKKSIEENGNIGVVVVDNKNNILSGNSRVKVMSSIEGEEYEIDVLVYTGGSNSFAKMISNIHFGEYNGLETGMFTDETLNDLHKEALSVDKSFKSKLSEFFSEKNEPRFVDEGIATTYSADNIKDELSQKFQEFNEKKLLELFVEITSDKAKEVYKSLVDAGYNIDDIILFTGENIL